MFSYADFFERSIFYSSAQAHAGVVNVYGAPEGSERFYGNIYYVTEDAEHGKSAIHPPLYRINIKMKKA